jgi:hypothetical protein
LAYNALFILGFVNFEWSLGLALLTAAMWRAISRTRPTVATAIGAVAATALFFCHVFGLGFFAILVGAGEVAALSAGRFMAGAVARRAGMLGIMFAVPAMLCALSPASDTAGPVGRMPLWFKIPYILCPFADYDARISLLISVALLPSIYLLLRRGTVRAAPGTAVASAILLMIYVTLPFGIGTSTFLDTRAAIMIGLLLFAGLAPAGLSRRLTILAGVTITTLLTLRIASVADTWRLNAHDLFDLRAAIAPLEPGSKVLVAMTDRTVQANRHFEAPKNRMLPGYESLYQHLAALIIIERHAFWPLEFTDPGKQPLIVLPPYDKLVGRQGDLPNVNALVAPTFADTIRYGPYIAEWSRDFDYLLLMDAGGLPDPAALMPDRLDLLNHSDFAALYRVHRPAP